MRCPACGHVRTRLDPLPDTCCPSCGVDYARNQRYIELGLLKPLTETPRRRPAIGLKGAAYLLVPLAMAAAGWYFVLAPVTTPQGPAVSNLAAHTGSVSAPESAQPRVVMYATSWCPYCAKARKFFQRNAIQYTEHDIEQDRHAEAAYAKLGGGGVPVIVVGGTAVHGYNETKLRSLLGSWLGRRNE